MSVEIKSMLAEACNSIERARSIKPKSTIELSALRWELYASLQNILDTVAIIIADLRLRKPSSYSDLGDVLYEEGLIGEEECNALKLIAKTRNTLAHAYRKLNTEDLGDIVKNILPIAEKLVHKLFKIIEDKSVDPRQQSKIWKKAEKVFKKYGVILAYLFGSRARGVHREDSDYDIAVLFDKDKTTILDEIKLALDLEKELNLHNVEVVALNKAYSTLIARVLKEGIPIYWRSLDELRRWERKTYLRTLRSTDLHEVYNKRVLKLNPNEEAEIHLEIAEKSLNEAKQYMEKKNPVQASEKLYKAVEECIKALAKTVKTPQLKEAEKRGKWDTWLLGRASTDLSKVLKEDKIRLAWTTAYDIHVWGFHEAKYRMEDVETALPLTEWLLNFTKQTITKQENSTKHNSDNTLRNTTSTSRRSD